MAPLMGPLYVPLRQLNRDNTVRQGFIQKKFVGQQTTQKPNSFIKFWFVNLHAI